MAHIGCRLEPHEKAKFNNILGFYGETQAFLSKCILAAIEGDHDKTIGTIIEEAQDEAGQR